MVQCSPDSSNVALAGVSGSEVIDDAVLHRFVGYHMRRAANILQSDLARTLKEVDLRMITMSVLTVIVGNPGLRQSQLADALAIERPNLVSVLDELEHRKLVIRTRVPTDRRAYALTPTHAGERLAAEALALTTQHEDRVFADMTSEERAQLVTLLRKLCETSDR